MITFSSLPLALVLTVMEAALTVSSLSALLLFYTYAMNSFKPTSAAPLAASAALFTTTTTACALLCATSSIPSNHSLIPRLHCVKPHKTHKVLALGFCKDMV